MKKVLPYFDGEAFLACLIIAVSVSAAITGWLLVQKGHLFRERLDLGPRMCGPYL